jgi:hypothetical protein
MKCKVFFKKSIVIVSIVAGAAVLILQGVGTPYVIW